MAKPPFMSPAPRPVSQPPATGVNGSEAHRPDSAGTTSTCPLSSSDGVLPGLSPAQYVGTAGVIGLGHPCRVRCSRGLRRDA